MDGVAIMRALLIADAPLIALVPVERIAAGDLPVGTPLDAIAVQSISVIDRNVLSPGSARHVTERVQVTPHAATYPRLKAIVRAVKHAAADFIGTAAGCTNVTVHTDAAGPDFMDEQASIHMKPQDFIVGYSEKR